MGVNILSPQLAWIVETRGMASLGALRRSRQDAAAAADEAAESVQSVSAHFAAPQCNTATGFVQ